VNDRAGEQGKLGHRHARQCRTERRNCRAPGLASQPGCTAGGGEQGLPAFTGETGDLVRLQSGQRALSDAITRGDPMTGRLGRKSLATAALSLFLAAAGRPQDLSNLMQLINQRFPPVHPADNQLAALHGAARDIEELGSMLLYAGVSQKDLQSFLPDDIHSKVADLSHVTLTLGQQEVVVTGDFALRLSDGEVRITGEAEVHCAVSVEEAALVLRPSASGIEVQSIDRQGTEAPESLVSAINALLDRFLLNLNGAMQTQRVPLQLRSIQVIDTAQLLKGLDLVTAAQGTKIGVDVALGSSAVLIDPQGIHVLADALVLTQQELDTLERALAANAPEPSGPAAAMPLSVSAKALSPPPLCGSLPDYPDARVQRLRKLCRQQQTTAVAKKAKKLSAAPPAQEDLDALYHQYQKDFLDKAELIDHKENLFWDQTAVAISRRALAVDLNKVLNLAQASADLHFPRYEGETKMTLTTPEAPDLKCEQNAGACESVFQFRPYDPRGCDSDCKTTNCVGPSWARICVDGVDLACQGRKIDCERLKEQERLAYEAEKAAALAAWTARKDACELAKAVTLAGCQANQIWLNAAANQDIGEIQARWQADDGEMHLSFDGLQVGDDLGSFAVHTTVSGGASLGADFTFVPHNLGNLICQAQWSGRVHAAAHLPLTDINLTGILTSPKNEEGRLLLTFTFSGKDITYKIEPPPVLALLSQNPQIAAYCAPAAVANQVGILGIAKLDDEVRKDTFSYSFGDREVTLEIPERTLQIGSREVRLVPTLQSSSLVIVAQ
jgi:hypothetical protein